MWWINFGSQSAGSSDAAGGLITYKQMGLSFFAVFLAPMVYYLYKKAKSLPEYFLAGSYIYLIFFVFPTEIHERYIYPALALLPFAAVKDKKIFWVLIVLTITLFLNNYAVLQTAFPQFASLGFITQYLPLDGGWTKIVSAVNLLLAIYLAIYFIYESFKKAK